MLDLFFPPICLACDRLIATGDAARFICRRCRTQLRPSPPPFCQRCHAPLMRTGRLPEEKNCQQCNAWPDELLHARSAFLMHPPADRIVHQLKYRGWHRLGEHMAAAMVRVWTSMPTVDVVIPVPTTTTRMRERGYNQAQVLAEAVAKGLNRECKLLLERTASKSTQTTLQPAARGANVAGAFRLQAGVSVHDAHILIVDDVLTTGATAIECTRTLTDAGARGASVLTYARALDTRRLLGN